MLQWFHFKEVFFFFSPNTLWDLYHWALSALLAFPFCLTSCVAFVLFLLILEGVMYVYESVDYEFLLVLLKIEL